MVGKGHQKSLRQQKGLIITMTILLSGPEKRYAKALFEMAEEAQATAPVLADLSALASAIQQSAELQRLLGNPLITSDKKANVLLALLPKAHKMTKTLVLLLASKARLVLVAGIAQCFEALMDEKEKCVRVLVKTAHPLSPAQKKEIEALAKKHAKGSKKVAMTEQVDESLIAGVRVQVGSTMVDASLAGSLKALKRELTV